MTVQDIFKQVKWGLHCKIIGTAKTAHLQNLRSKVEKYAKINIDTDGMM